MALFTIIARTTDGIPLISYEHEQSNVSDITDKAINIISTFDLNTPSKCSIQLSPDYIFHYTIDNSVCFMVLTETGLPKRHAFSFLAEAKKYFTMEFGDQIYQFSRPYAAISFEATIKKIAQRFADPKTRDSLRALHESLGEISGIMQKNIEDVLSRGDKIESVESRSRELLAQSQKFKSKSQAINARGLYEKYGPLMFVVAIVVLYLLFRLIYK